MRFSSKKRSQFFLVFFCVHFSFPTGSWLCSLYLQMLFIVFLGHLKLFYKISFLAQLVSAQKLSALFTLRHFCSVANLKFKCFAGLFCLD